MAVLSVTGLGAAVAAGSGAGVRTAPVGSSGPSLLAAEDRAATAGASPTPSLKPSPTAPARPSRNGRADGVVDSDGRIDPAGYRRMAARLGTAAGVAYRFGPSAKTYGPAPKGRATAYQPPSKPVDVHGNGPARTYQVAGPQDASKNDYSSNQGQLGYVPDAASRSRLGIDHVATLEMGENTYAEKPQLTWTYYGGGHPEVEFTGDGAGVKCATKAGARFGRFVAQARAYAHGEFTANTFVAFDSGLIATAGTNTAQAGMCLQLPKGLRPSAISVTNGNEFVLVTVWDPAALRSRLAVIAVGGAQKKGEFWDYEWPELYPGMANYGRPTFLKLLGLVDLPVAAPTSLSAVSDYAFGEWLAKPGGGNVQRGDMPLSDEANRQTFVTGENRLKRSRAGYAVIASKSERKVVFVDLQPLFARITGAYFRSRAEFDGTRDVGQGSRQWPPTLAAAPAERPKVVTTVSLAQPPTAVAAELTGAGNPRAYVATQEGRLRVFAVGGLATTAAARAGAVRAVGAITVGRNPTWITYPKDHGWAGKQAVSPAMALDDTLIVTSRGDRRVDWVTLKGNTGRITRSLRDSRLVDPIAAEDNNNHGTESYLLSVADHGAKRLFGYRYGPVIFHTNGDARYGVGADGKARFEFGGAYDPHGAPFSISVTNVT